jgi:hypothetical protein
VFEPNHVHYIPSLTPLRGSKSVFFSHNDLPKDRFLNFQVLSSGYQTETRSTILCQEDFILPSELIEQVSQQGFYIQPELIQGIINAATLLERKQYLKAEPYPPTEECERHANSVKPKTIHALTIPMDNWGS